MAYFLSICQNRYLNTFEKECAGSNGNTCLTNLICVPHWAYWFSWRLRVVEHARMAESRSGCAIRAPHWVSAWRDVTHHRRVPCFIFLPCRCLVRCLRQKPNALAQLSLSSAGQWTELPAAVCQLNLCLWANVARCCLSLRLHADPVSEPCDNFNLGIKLRPRLRSGYACCRVRICLCGKLLSTFCKEVKLFKLNFSLFFFYFKYNHKTKP